MFHILLNIMNYINILFHFKG